MEYLEPKVARDMPGLRLALTAHMPAPYSMAARAVLDYRKVPYTPVLQVGAGGNEDLVAWTGHRNAPVAVYENEPPRTGWLDILNLAERLGEGPSLVPADLVTRQRMIGWINELIGENGLIWQARLIMLGLGGPERAAREADRNPMYGAYGYSEAARSAAPARVAEILDGFTAFTRAALDRPDGQKFLMGGDTLSALDIYWVYFSQLLKTLPHEECPMPEMLRKSYDRGSEVIGGCDPILIEQRDWVRRHYLPGPMTF